MNLLPYELENEVYSYVGKHKIAELLEFNIKHYNTEIIYNFNSFSQLQDRYDVENIFELDEMKDEIMINGDFRYCRDEMSFYCFLLNYKLLNGTIDALLDSSYNPKFFDWDTILFVGRYKYYSFIE